MHFYNRDLTGKISILGVPTHQQIIAVKILNDEDKSDSHEITIKVVLVSIIMFPVPKLLYTLAKIAKNAYKPNHLNMALKTRPNSSHIYFKKRKNLDKNITESTGRLWLYCGG